MQRISKIRTAILLAVVLAWSAGCGDGGGSGTLKVTTYGEDFIEKEIPAAASGGEGLVDGYTIKYSKFLVTLSDLKIADSDGEIGGQLVGPVVFDVHPVGPHTVTTFDSIDARRWDRVSVLLAPAKEATAGNATAADVKVMNDNGYSVYVEGAADKGGKKLFFKWGFTAKTHYTECYKKSSGNGLVVPTGGSATMEFTIHGDHLLYDDLQSSDPSLRFEAVAGADADADGEVTIAELAKVDLTTLPAGQYGTGGAGNIKNLRQFIEALSRTLVHFQGEGHCHSSTQ